MKTISVQNNSMMSSLEIVKLTGKQKSHIHRDIRYLVDSLDDNFLDSIEYQEIKDNRGYAKEIIINKILAELLLSKYDGLLRMPLGLREDSAIKTIEQILGVNLIRQYRVGKYRIDAYDKKNNIAYEIDESEHKYKKEQDAKREQHITKKIGCKFIRIKL